MRNDNGWFTCADDQGAVYLPVWPHPDYASACLAEEWAGAVPEPIAIRLWLEKWIPGLKRDGILVDVFPVNVIESGKVIHGVAIHPDELSQDLEDELVKYDKQEQF